MAEEPKKRAWQRKKREDLVPEMLLLGDSEQEDAFYSLTDSAVYMGMTPTGFQFMLDGLKEKGHPVPIWEKGYGTGRYIKVKDLDDLRRARPVEE